MARNRLINCDFLLTSFMDIPNKAKLLYLVMIINADDKGFVGNTSKIIKDLKENDEEYNKTISLELLDDTYESALLTLCNRGYLYTFIDNYGNHIHLIRHWFIHNKWIKGLYTNYKRFYDLVDIKDGKYIKKPLKENKINQNKTTITNNSNTKENNKDKWDELLGDEPKQEPQDDDELPFE